MVEHFLGKEEVDSSILFNGSELTVRPGSYRDCSKALPIFDHNAVPSEHSLDHPSAGGLKQIEK